MRYRLVTFDLMPVRVRHGRWQRRAFYVAKVSAFIVLAAAVTGTLYIGLFLSDDIKARALSLISQTVNTEISMSEPELDLLTEFPYASLHFNDVKCRGVTVSLQHNTLFTARHVSLLFSVWDFLFGNIAFKRITLEDGTIYLVRNESGKANWEIFNVSELPSGPTRRAIFSLQRIDIQNFSLTFSDHYLHNRATLRLKTFELAGNLKDEDPNLIVESVFELDSMRLANGFHPSPAGYHLLASLEAKTEEKIYTLKTCRISGGNNRLLNLSGRVTSMGQEGFGLQASGSLLMLQQKELENFLPTNAIQWPEHLTLSGDVKINFRAEGLAGPQNTPSVHMDFSFENGRIWVTRQPEHSVMYCIAKGDADWHEGNIRFRVPLMALSSPNGTRIRTALRYLRHAEHTGTLQVKGTISATDLWPLITGSFPQGVRGTLNTSAALHFKDRTLSSFSGKIEFEDVIFPLWNGMDSLKLSRGFCFMQQYGMVVTLEEGHIFGENFRGQLIFPLKNGSLTPTEKNVNAFIEADRLNLSNLPEKFWNTPLLENFMPSDLLRLCPRLRLVADQVTYQDLNARDVEVLICPNTGAAWNVHLRGNLCGGRLSVLSDLRFLPSQNLRIHTLGYLSTFQVECLTTGLRSLSPRYFFPDLNAEGAAFHFRRLSLASPRAQVVSQWHTVLQAQSGTVSGSSWLNNLAEATGMPDWKRTEFQNLYYEAWGDSSMTFEARAEIRQKNIAVRLIQSRKIQAQEMEFPEFLSSRIKSQWTAGSRLRDFRDEGGRLYVPLNTEGFTEDFSARAFRETWLQRPFSPAEEMPETLRSFPDDCSSFRISPHDTLTEGTKRSRR